MRLDGKLLVDDGKGVSGPYFFYSVPIIFSHMDNLQTRQFQEERKIIYMGFR
jgi:hypothetical protein